jgi:hypothetical protein
MFTHRKRYPALIIRSSLLIGYFFLFAAQSNYQYFDLANFFVYGHGAATAGNTALARQKDAVATAVAKQQQQEPQHSLTLQGKHQRIGHLAIDKRYHSQQGLRIPPIRAPGVISYIVVRTRFYIPTPAFFSADPPTNALRGPPSAA